MSITFIISTIIVISCGLFLMILGLSGMIRKGIKNDMKDLLKEK